MNNATLNIKSPEHLLAQVHAMKCESEDRLQDLIDSLTQHNNIAAANIFSHAIELIKLSLIDIEQRAKGMQLPEIPPWESQWYFDNQPDSACIDRAHYLMTPLQALNLAIFNENRLHEFFKLQAEKGINKDVRLIANELRSQEKLLIEQMHSLITQFEISEINDNEDFDPPNTPE